MASRQLPPGHLGNDTRSPIRSNVALRWTSNIVAAPPPPKDARSPVKRWPPVQAQAPVVTTVASKAALQPAVEENATVSAFQSARAVFENRKSLAASPPPHPPIRHRFAFPIEKHHSTTSDLSASSCSTLDSESDRKLEESTAVNYEPEPSSPVRLVVKKMEAEIVDTTLSKQADKAMEPVNSVAPSPVTQVSRENATQSQQTLVRSPSHNEIDPFQLLLPIENIPTLPDEITCVYDKAAIEMEKNIKKVVRKLLRKDKARLEEFKVNSRLFGTDFLDSNAYLNTLIKDFGAIRALQLVPCLLSIQPNLVKSKALLLTAKNYLLRNEDELKHELQLLNSKRITNVNLDKETMPAAGVVRDGSSTEVSSVASRKTTSPTSDVVCSPSGHAASDPTQVDTAFSTTASPVFQPPSLSVVPPLMTLAQRKDDGSTEEVMTKSKVVELTPESQTMPRVETPPPLLSIAVSTPSRISSTTPIMQDYAPTPAPTKYTASEISTKAEEDCKSLFGEINKPITLEKNQKPQQAEIPAAPLSPASSVHSFDEAESLFGERLSPSSRTSRKSVTWGDTQTVEIPDKMTQTAKKPAPLLFGLATAAAFESDDDESDFSD